LARLSFDGAYAKDLFARSVKCLQGLDATIVHGPELTVTEPDAEALAERFYAEKVDVVLLQYGTFALGTLIPILADRLTAPIILWGVPEPSLEGPKLRSNSLCGINMNAHTLMRLGRKYDYIFCQPEEAPAQLARTLRVLGCLKRLRRSKVGLVGYRVPGFYTSTFDEMGLRRLLGVEVHHVTLAEIIDEARSVAPGRRDEEVREIRASAGACDAAPAELDQAGALAVAMRQIAERNRLTAYAVKCWPEFAAHYGIMPCSTISRLTDLGLLTACEGDVYGVVTMLMENYLSGRTPMFCDFIAMEEERNVGLAWHCGAAPTCLAAKGATIQLGKHPTVDGGGKKGVNISFPIEGQGPVTMARLSVGPRGLRLFFAGGEATRPKANLAGNCWAVCFQRPVRELVDVILREGLEHHTALVHADLRDDLRSLARWIDLETLDVDGK
jgi:L-fucose isomerase-like protein